MNPSPLSITRLRTDYRVDPLGIGERRPRLSWCLVSSIAATRQSKYRIRVAGSPEELSRPNLWDSGWVDSAQSSQIRYDGRELEARQQVWWTVDCVDNHGNGASAEPATWSMGLLDKGDWRAHWISASRDVFKRDSGSIPGDATTPGSVVQFRREFSAPESVQKAVLYASARGLLEIWINGHRVSEDQLCPEWTDYRIRLHYRTFDVTGLLKPGTNAIGAYLGDGWYSGYVGWQETRGRYGLRNSLLCQLEMTLENGATEQCLTDGNWRCNTGPIIASDFMMGESYDARREHQGWDQPDFDDSDWLAAEVIDPPSAALVAQVSEPVRIMETIRPVGIHRRNEGVYVFDLGQNIAGWIRLKVRGTAGQTIKIRHGERLAEDGSLYTANLRRAQATDVYRLRGDGWEEWQPRFTFHGFQYVEISGLENAPDFSTVTGCAIHSGTPPAGHFVCGHPGVNRLWNNCLWSQKDNFLSVPTDCPQRDERLGWMGDAQVFLRTAMYNMDVAAFFSKWMTDVADAQTDEGVYPDTAPRLPENEGNFVGLDGLAASPAWADAGIIIPWTMWKVYGDTTILETHWSGMRAWMAYLARTNPDRIRVNGLGNNYGDWLCIPADTSFRTHSPMKNLLATAFWADSARKMREIATVLGHDGEAREFQSLLEDIRRAFQETFLRGDGLLTVETQTAYLLVLAFGLMPVQQRPVAAQRLADLIRQNGNRLSTGFVGIRFLNPILSDWGFGDLAYDLLLREDYPSWLYPVIHGATTIWERWNGWTREDGFFDPQMNSFNHYSLGSVGEWLFSHVLGIQPDEAQPGFQAFVLKPFPSPRLGWVKGFHDCIRGRIESAWQWTNNRFTWTIDIPANTVATVLIPLGDDERVWIDGQLVEGNLCRVSGDAQRARILLESGNHTLQSTYTG